MLIWVTISAVSTVHNGNGKASACAIPSPATAATVMRKVSASCTRFLRIQARSQRRETSMRFTGLAKRSPLQQRTMAASPRKGPDEAKRRATRCRGVAFLSLHTESRNLEVLP